MNSMNETRQTTATEQRPTPVKPNRKRWLPFLVLPLLAIGLSFGIVRTHEMKNISACVVNFVCNDAIDRQRGDYRKVQYGFPLTYRATESFTRIPNSVTAYGSTVREFQPFNPVFAALNVLFWSTLLQYTWKLPNRFGKKRGTPQSAP